MTNPERRLDTVVVRVNWLRRHVPTAFANLAAVEADADGWGSSGTSEVHSGEVANPTESAAVASADAGLAYRAIDQGIVEVEERLAELIERVKDVHDRRANDVGVDVSREVKEAQCSGGIDEWAKPGCEELAIRNVEVAGGVWLPLCSPCRRRFQRWKTNDGASFSEGRRG
jgi:hypothetical protein